VICADHASEVVREIDSRRSGGNGRPRARAGMAQLDA
jgi:hypothetical protein